MSALSDAKSALSDARAARAVLHGPLTEARERYLLARQAAEYMEHHNSMAALAPTFADAAAEYERLDAENSAATASVNKAKAVYDAAARESERLAEAETKAELLQDGWTETPDGQWFCLEAPKVFPKARKHLPR